MKLYYVDTYDGAVYRSAWSPKGDIPLPWYLGRPAQFSTWLHAYLMMKVIKYLRKIGGV